MGVTRSWDARVAVRLNVVKPPVSPERQREILWLIAASILVAAGLALVYAAKTREFTAFEDAFHRGDLLNLNAASSPADFTPFLQIVQPAEQQAVAEKLWVYLERARPLANVGALARAHAGLAIARVKPLLAVRTPHQFRLRFAEWIAVYFGAFYAVHLLWRWRRFRGDGSILPALHLLTGLGLILSVSLRDPLRDTLEFSKFAWGVALGCSLLLLPLFRFFDWRRYSTWIYTPLLASFGLFAVLLRFGSGPTGSDSKVNLGPFQPVELIKVLLVLFMAAYFARRWEWLRELRERRVLPPGLRWINLPRASHALPVVCAVACALLMFFLLKDLGPALVTGFLFLAMYGVARGKAGLAIIGVAIVVGGVIAGYRAGRPPTVVDRISMWLSPWDNNVRGGDQLAHSLWALSTGGAVGSGPGLGDPGMIPAGHTDLVLPAIGEEWGFCGVLAAALLFTFLFSRCMRAALHAPDEHATFLSLGFGTLIAIEISLISAGAFGLLPLSGVASPFLSSGNTAMLANFFIFAVIAAISHRARSRHTGPPFVRGVRCLSVVLSVVLCALVAKAAYVQTIRDGDLIARDTLVFQADGVKRAQHNPRLNSLAHELTRGTIYDRNGIIMATSRWDELEQNRAALQALGVSIDSACSRMDSRQYPFGAATAHLLGDLRSGENFHASNTSLIEHDQNVKLQGFAAYAELAGYVRHRHQPANEAMRLLHARDRTVKTSIDIRLQLRAAEILDRRLRQFHKDKGALVVMDPESGDLLASVSAPAPSGRGESTPDELLDRARYGQYPPGSTFKLVTALAALRLDSALANKRFHCGPLGGSRVGTRIPGWNRPIRDDIGDSAHGTIEMSRAIAVSCNAYFAQLGVFAVGAKGLDEMADLLEIPAGERAELQKMLPFAAYGQGPVLMTPFKMARVSAAIAAGGAMPQGRWVLDDSNSRRQPAKPIVPQEQASFVASAMRSVVTSGTGRRAMAGLPVSVAGKTGTAQVEEGLPHSWFTGFAPYDAPSPRRIAFAVVVEHGGYGAQAAAPIARDLISAAAELGIIANSSTVR